MSGDVIVTVTLNAALNVSYQAAAAPGANGITPVSRPVYRAGGRGVTVARVLREFGHDVLAAGLAGGAAGELIGQDLARSGVPAEFTKIRGESRRLFTFLPSGPTYGEPGPYITTEELGRFAGDYRSLLGSAAAVVLSGSLPDGLPPDMYATLVRYAAEAGVPAILDAGGEELLLAVRNQPALVVADSADAGAGHALLRLGAVAAAVRGDCTVEVTTGTGQWTASVPLPDGVALDRGALVAGLVPGELLGWSWPDRLRHCLALATSVTPAGDVDPRAYETLLDTVAIASV
ncbi:MAG TPA: PfkB family carbohydrate kinase [Streptosporangiaceae bacterium]